MEDVATFLINNGFRGTEREIRYINDKCSVLIDEENEFYQVEFDGYTCFSSNLSIYWLIGLLTYENLIDRNYV